MREIKFRAWCKIDNAMINTMSIQNMIHQKVNEFSIAQLEEDIVFMQYTGLKDKNGVEIYEGDIVKRTSINKFWIEEKRIDFDKVIYKAPSFSIFDLTMGNYKGQSLEVIGNIYENKDLINQD